MAALLWGCFGRWGSNAAGRAVGQDDAAPACPQRSSCSAQPQHLLAPVSKVAPDGVTCMLKDDSGQLPAICGVGYAGSEAGLSGMCDTGMPMLTPNHSSQGCQWVSTSSSSTLCHQPLPPLQQPPNCTDAPAHLPVKPTDAAYISLDDDRMVGRVQLGAAASNSSPLLGPSSTQPLGGGLHSISAISSIASDSSALVAAMSTGAAAGSTPTLPLIQSLQSYACLDSMLIKRSDASCTSPTRPIPDAAQCDSAGSNITPRAYLPKPSSLPGFKQLAIPGSKGSDDMFNLTPTSRGSGSSTRPSSINDHDMPSMRTIIAATPPIDEPQPMLTASSVRSASLGVQPDPVVQPQAQPLQPRWYAQLDLKPVQVQSAGAPCTCHSCGAGASTHVHQTSRHSSSSMPQDGHNPHTRHPFQPPPSGCNSPHGSSARSADLVISEPETADAYQDNVLLSMLYSNAILVGGDEPMDGDASSGLLPRISPTPSATSASVRRENTDDALDGVLVPLSLLDPDAPAGSQEQLEVSGESPTWPAAQQAALLQQQQQQQQPPPSTELSSVTFTSPSAPRLMAVAIGGKLVDVPSVSLDTQSCRSLPAGVLGGRGFNASPWVQSQPLPGSNQGMLVKQDGRGLGTSAPLLGAARQSRFGRPGMCSPMMLLSSTQDLNSIAEEEEDNPPCHPTM